MIKSVKYIDEKGSLDIEFTSIHQYKIQIEDINPEVSKFTLKIEFDNPIALFRNHDYTWMDLNQKRFANWYSPKILKLQDGTIVQANQNIGIWEIERKSKTLYWHFNPKNAKPIANYDKLNVKTIEQAKSPLNLKYALALLFSKDVGVEFSRSKIPFSAITCFTDHCDFDTEENLIKQREFFKKYNIKVTKGFFLNHFSKRKNTASVEFNRDEFEEWIKDGHELAYHSLSQSKKNRKESHNDFLVFKPPFTNLPTWIDHGFQIYNFTQSGFRDEMNKDYGCHLKEKGINNLWNYIDSGTAAKGVINQINPNTFNLGSYYRGVKELGFKTGLGLMAKNVIFHYYSNDYVLRLYRSVAQYLKTIKTKKRIKRHFQFVIEAIKLVMFFIPIMLLWYRKRRKSYPLSVYNPLFFEHVLDKKLFTVFQTIEMIDFKNALCKNNIDTLVSEKGLFIAHTYFSSPMKYHTGRLFNNQQEIDNTISEYFEYLSQKISLKEIWNPTLAELVDFMRPIKNIVFDCDSTGKIFILPNVNNIATRPVK